MHAPRIIVECFQGLGYHHSAPGDETDLEERACLEEYADVYKVKQGLCVHAPHTIVCCFQTSWNASCSSVFALFFTLSFEF